MDGEAQNFLQVGKVTGNKSGTKAAVKFHCVRQAGAGGWSWSAVREKYCYLTGGWRLELEGCERETL